MGYSSTSCMDAVLAPLSERLYSRSERNSTTSTSVFKYTIVLLEQTILSGIQYEANSYLIMSLYTFYCHSSQGRPNVALAHPDRGMTQYMSLYNIIIHTIYM